MATLAELVGRAQGRGFTPNPWLWQNILRQANVRAFPRGPMVTAPAIVPSSATSAPPDALTALGAAPSMMRLMPGGATFGAMPTIDQAIADAGAFLNLGTSLAADNVPGAVGGALRTGTALARYADLPLVGQALGTLSGPFNLAMGIESGNLGAIGSGAASTLAGLGSLATSASGLGPAVAAGANPASLAALGATGAEIAGASPTLATIGSGLSTTASLAALPAAIAAMFWANMQAQRAEQAANQSRETRGILRDFNVAWPQLSRAPEIAERFNEAGLLSGPEQLDAYRQVMEDSGTAINALQAISRYSGTGGGRQTGPFRYPGSDTSVIDASAPSLAVNAYLSNIKAIDALAQLGEPTNPARDPRTIAGDLAYWAGLKDFYPYGIPPEYSGESYTFDESSTDWESYFPSGPGMPYGTAASEAFVPGQLMKQLTDFYSRANPDFASSLFAREAQRFGSTAFPSETQGLSELASTLPADTTTLSAKVSRGGVRQPAPVSAVADPAVLAQSTETSGASLDRLLTESRAFLGAI